MKVLDFMVGVMILMCSWVIAFNIGYKSHYDTHDQAESNLIWINDIRVHKDSLIDIKPIYSEPNEQIGCWIKVTYQGNETYIECLDEKGYSWEEWRDSFLMNFDGYSIEVEK